MLNDPLNLGLVTIALAVLRILMIPLIVYNLVWTVGGVVDLVKGQALSSSIHKTTVFFFSAGVLGYHMLAFLGHSALDWTTPWSLLLQCVLFLATIMALVSKGFAVASDFDESDWLFTNNNLDVAVRIAEMNQLDPEFTKNMLEAGESTMAVHLAKKAIADNAD